MMTAMARKTSPEAEYLPNWDYFAVIPSCSHFTMVAKRIQVHKNRKCGNLTPAASLFTSLDDSSNSYNFCDAVAAVVKASLIENFKEKSNPSCADAFHRTSAVLLGSSSKLSKCKKGTSGVCHTCRNHCFI